MGELSLFAMRKRKLGGDLPFSLKRRCKEDGTRLFCGAQCQVKRLRAQTGVLKAPSEQQKTPFYCASDRAVAQGGGVTFSSRCVPGHPGGPLRARVGPAGSRGSCQKSGNSLINWNHFHL